MGEGSDQFVIYAGSLSAKSDLAAAFSFPSAIPQTLFFPTVHIHDGEVHEKAGFDHMLYCQATGLNHRDWHESPSLAVTFVKCGLTQNIVQAGHHVHRRVLHGMLANGDVVVKAGKLSI